MAEVREWNITSIDQPAHIKVLRGPGGRYDFEISYYGTTMRDALNVVKTARIELEGELKATEVQK